MNFAEPKKRYEQQGDSKSKGRKPISCKPKRKLSSFYALPFRFKNLRGVCGSSLDSFEYSIG